MARLGYARYGAQGTGVSASVGQQDHEPGSARSWTPGQTPHADPRGPDPGHADALRAAARGRVSTRLYLLLERAPRGGHFPALRGPRDVRGGGRHLLRPHPLTHEPHGRRFQLGHRRSRRNSASHAATSLAAQPMAVATDEQRQRRRGMGPGWRRYRIDADARAAPEAPSLPPWTMRSSDAATPRTAASFGNADVPGHRLAPPIGPHGAAQTDACGDAQAGKDRVHHP